MGQAVVGRVAIKARELRPGEAFAARVPAGGLVEVIDLEGKQVAELVAFSGTDLGERLSLGRTRQLTQSIVFQLGMSLHSSRGKAMLELVEDTVGRHDILMATQPAGDPPQAGDPPKVNDDSDPADAANAPGGSANEAPPARAEGFASVLADFGIERADAPDPVNLFMNVGVMQKGDLEVRPPTSERGDRVLFRALDELVVAVRCSDATDATNDEKPTNILVRVYR